MLKYSLWSDDNDSRVIKLSNAVEQTDRSNQPAAMFGASVYIIAYRNAEIGHRADGQRTFVGMAQLTSTWQPLEWQNSPFSFPHRGALHAHWIFCREFSAPKWIWVATSEGFKHLNALGDGDEITKTAGDEIFQIYRDTPIKAKGVSFATR